MTPRRKSGLFTRKNPPFTGRKKYVRSAKKEPIGVALKTLIGNTPRNIRRNAKGVSIVKNKKGLTNRGNPQIVFTTLSIEPGPTTNKVPQKHDSVVRMLHPKEPRLWCHCSCEYFLFHLEYALWKHKASAIVHGNGNPAVVTNPNNIPYLCKHLYKVLRRETTVKQLKKLYDLKK